MKRLIPVLIAIALVLSSMAFCLPALAEGEPLYFKSVGLTLDVAKILDQSPNLTVFSELSVISRDPCYMSIILVEYYALEKEILTELNQEYDGFSEAEKEEYAAFKRDITTELGLIVVTDAEDSQSEFRFLADNMLGPDASVEEFATEGPYHYALLLRTPDDLMERYDAWAQYADNSAEVLEEKAMVSADIENVCATLLEQLKVAELSTPVDPCAGMVDQILAFETTDLDGNAVSSADLFKDNRITMVNVWGTWCYACVSEMEELSRIHTRLREKGCGIVGVEKENKPLEEVGDTARAIMAESGTNYPNVIMPGDNPIFSMVHGYPCSIFVNSEGRVLSLPLEGAAITQYEATIDKLLAGEAVTTTPDDAGASKNDTGDYRVVVYDHEGQPVKGVVIQFCDDTTCAMQKTDANGVATFSDKEQKVYDVHVLSVPEGYAMQTSGYKTLDTFSDVSVFLEKAA